MRYGSVCSGIEAASIAWEPLGWTAAWLSEIEPFPSAVLAHHWPDVPNLGNMLALPDRVDTGEIEAPDVLVGGTPCQAFSVAGNRESLADARGGLTLSYVELADAIDRQRAKRGEHPCIIVWENVPGVLSTKDNAFGCFLAGLAGEDEPLLPPGKRGTNAGIVLGPKRAIAWRILDAQYFGLAQRRRRVFVVASARDGFDPSQVLLEFDGVRRDSPPRRETRQETAGDAGPGFEVAGTLDSRVKGGGFPGSDGAMGGHVVPAQKWPAEIASTLNAAFGSKQGLEDQHVNGGCPLFVPAAIPILEPGSRTGKSTTDVRAGIGIGASGDPMFTLQAGKQHGVACVSVTGDIAHTLNTANNGKGCSEDGTGRGVPTIAFSSKDYGADASDDMAPTLRAGGHADSHANAGVPPAVTVALRGREGGATAEVGGEVATALWASSGGGDKPHVLAYDTPNITSPQNGTNPKPGDPCFTLASGQHPPLLTGMAVRRLTPTECERLQGFTHRVETYRVSACWGDRSLESAAAGTPCTTVQSSVLRVEDVERLENALSAKSLLTNAPQNSESLADVHVLINCEGKKAALLSAGRLIWSASIADEQSACRPPTLPESSALRLAQMLRSGVKTTQAGKAGPPQNGTACTDQERGKNYASKFGEVPTDAAFAAERGTENQTRFTMYITSILGQTPQKKDLNEITLFSSAIRAIASYTHEITPLASSFSLDVTVVLPHTLVPYRNKPAADGPRYRAIGNSMAVPCMAWIGRRILQQLKGPR